MSILNHTKKEKTELINVLRIALESLGDNVKQDDPAKLYRRLQKGRPVRVDCLVPFIAKMTRHDLTVIASTGDVFTADLTKL